MISAVDDLLYTEELYRLTPKPCIALTKAWSELSEEEKALLSKITDALRTRIHPSLSLDGFTVVQIPQLDLSEWNEKPTKLIYFGPPIKGLQNYEVIEANNTRMVLAHSLSDLIPDEGSRAKLWQALQKLF